MYLLGLYYPINVITTELIISHFLWKLKRRFMISHTLRTLLLKNLIFLNNGNASTNTGKLTKITFLSYIQCIQREKMFTIEIENGHRAPSKPSVYNN